jgi:hypothetical protein
MAVTVNANMTGGNGASGQSQQATSVTALTANGLTIAAGANTSLVVPVVWSNGGTVPTGVTVNWDNGGAPQAMTLAGSIQSPGGGPHAAIYYLQNPTTGNRTLQLNWTNVADCVAGAIAFDNVGSYVSGDTVQNNTNTVTITSAAGDATISVYNCDGGTPVGDKTLIWANSALGPSAAANYNIGGTSTHTYEIGTSSTRCTVGIHLQQFSGGGNVIAPMPFYKTIDIYE